MKFTLRLSIVCSLLVGTACVNPSFDDSEINFSGVEASTQSIYGGTATSGDPQVYGLRMVYSNAEGACTATLIGARTLLTAAHCADGVIGQSVQILAINGPKLYSNDDTDYIEITEKRVHTGWGGNPGENADDLALLLLEHTVTVPPKPWNLSASNVGSGKPVRMVGYGNTETGGSGSKKETAQEIDQVTTHLLHFDQRNGHGVCQGDSGGPVFATGTDGVERIIGVASFVSGGCDYAGAHTRVDAYAAWITTWLQEKETPTCARDGLCKQGCQTPDIDCTCGADGQCTTACSDPTLDPDCGKNCAKDSVCSETGTKCAVADPDCAGLGEYCSKPIQCPDRMCTNDSQHEDYYCSTACSTTVKCPAGFECSNKVCKKEKQPEAEPGEACTKGDTWCTQYTECLGKPTTCVETCESDGDCTEQNYACTGKDGDKKFCVAKKEAEQPKEPPKQNPTTPTTGLTPAGTPAPVMGCASAPVSNLWLVLAAMTFVVSRRRRG